MKKICNAAPEEIHRKINVELKTIMKHSCNRVFLASHSVSLYPISTDGVLYYIWHQKQLYQEKKVRET